MYTPGSRPKLGTFKVAQLGNLDNHSGDTTQVCIKQCIRRMPSATAQQTIMVYDNRKQAELLSLEITCSRWANALMGIVYQFADSYPDPPSLEIPRMSYVATALAIGTENTQQTILIEDLIDEVQEGPFVKYINNNSAKPLVFPGDDERTNVAEFLAFCQHIQYEKTGKLAYVSDFQGTFIDSLRAEQQHTKCYCSGGRTLLTDPQIITAPYVRFVVIFFSLTPIN
jgi:hypothetical protein